MKTFKIIEEGRLDNNQMKDIRGGITCNENDIVKYSNTCGTSTNKITCPMGYRNCGNGTKRTCSATKGYSGYPVITDFDDIITG